MFSFQETFSCALWLIVDRWLSYLLALIPDPKDVYMSHITGHGPSEGSTTEGSWREKIPVELFNAPSDMAASVAGRIADLIRERAAASRSVILGLPTGSTPIGVYRHLIRMYQEDGLDFSNVITFNLDEYYPMSPDALQSYHRFMRENFFDHVNIPAANIHIPRGDLERQDIAAWCANYERQIAEAGGLDLILLGIGRTGHIGFNEPGSGPETRTRRIILDEITRKDAASDFFGDENVPREAVTMGVGTILDARQIILMATGEHKAPIIRRAVEEKVTNAVTASYLQRHPSALICLDRAAAGELTRIKTPWLVREIEWTEERREQAVIWLAERTEKAILTLDESDFHRHYLHALANQYTDIDILCKHVFERLRQRIAYSEDLPSEQKMILFSPHPDDDVISMGGMLDKCVRNGNDMTVAYMTNGSVAVFDADVRRHLRFMRMSAEFFGGDAGVLAKLDSLRKALDSKSPGDVDSVDVQLIKAYIRYSEAVAGIEVMGLHQKHARFLDMPFYKTGTVRKEPIGEEDVQIVYDLLVEKKPDHIFVAGDLSDPHGTHRMCYFAIQQALNRFRAEYPAAEHPLVWLYRGAWQEWEIDEADVFIPMSKADLDRKVEAIFKHESQKDRAMYPGAHDAREFWERAKQRNQKTAKRLDALGLPQFYAVEAYVCVNELPD
jgi:glucosamine-6-phosphate deaminase